MMTTDERVAAYREIDRRMTALEKKRDALVSLASEIERERCALLLDIERINAGVWNNEVAS